MKAKKRQTSKQTPAKLPQGWYPVAPEGVLQEGMWLRRHNAEKAGHKKRSKP